MAQPRLIDAYLDDLRAVLGRVQHLEEIILEVEDHLREAIERWERAGIPEDEATRRALERFGPAQVVSRPFLDRGSPALPTQFTRAAGAAAVVGAVLTVFSVVLMTAFDGGASRVLLMTMPAAALLALVFAVVGLGLRHGGRLGGAGSAAYTVLGLGTVIGVVIPWMAPVIALVAFSLAFTVLGAGLVRAAILPRGAALLFACGWPVASAVGGVGLVIGAETAPFMGLGAAVFAAGLAWLGLAMARERAVDDDPLSPTTA